MNIQGALFAFLRADSALMALLDTYDGGPACFSAPVPDDLQIRYLPALYIDPPASDEADDTYSEDYRQVLSRVRLYQRPDENRNSTLPLILAAERARTVLRGFNNEPITGGNVVSTDVAGPEDAPTSDTALAGRLLTVRQFIKEDA